jgi:fucose permease
MIVMAIVGGAIFTPVVGLIFEAARSMATAMLVPLACYPSLRTMLSSARGPRQAGCSCRARPL